MNDLCFIFRLLEVCPRNARTAREIRQLRRI
jgi:hypothetical protein